MTLTGICRLPHAYGERPDRHTKTFIFTVSGEDAWYRILQRYGDHTRYRDAWSQACRTAEAQQERTHKPQLLEAIDYPRHYPQGRTFRIVNYGEFARPLTYGKAGPGSIIDPAAAAVPEGTS